MIPSVKSPPYQDRLEQLNLWSLEDRRIRADVIEVFKIIHGIWVLLKAVRNRAASGHRPDGCRPGRSRFESLHDRPDTISSPRSCIVTIGWLLELFNSTALRT